ncbi:MAG: hypothetical protein HFJ54_00795 [Clostridia bacterium]|nr:hypothetical protein [Clostridia bacterium]
MSQIEAFIPNAKELKSRGIPKGLTKREIGRGINEGFIEWYRVEVLKNKDEVVYKNLTSVMYKLQEYLDNQGFDGTSVMAEYGDNDYEHLFDTLNMSKPTGLAFVRILDVMYYLLEKKRETGIDDIIKYYEIEADNSVTPEFLSRYGKQIQSLEIFSKLKSEYERMPYRASTFKEFVVKKSKEANQVLSRYESLATRLLGMALEKGRKNIGKLENNDIADLMNEVIILAAQNVDDIADGMKISINRNSSKPKRKNIKSLNKKRNKKISLENRIIPKRTKVDRTSLEIEEDIEVDGTSLEREEGEAKTEGLEIDTASLEREEGETETEGLEIDTANLEMKDSEEEIGVGREIASVNSHGRIANDIINGARNTIEDIAEDISDVIDDVRYNVRDMADDISFGIRQMKRPRVSDRPKRYLSKEAKISLVTLAAIAGVSIGALVMYLKGENSKLQDTPNINSEMTIPSEEHIVPQPPKESLEKQDVEPEVSEKATLPFLNGNGTISLKKGATIYRSSDKEGGKTTLKYDYEDLIIDYIKVMKDNEKVDSGDLSVLEEFVKTAEDEGTSIMMRLAVEKNEERVYIAWCDYTEMLENVKDKDEIEK